MKVKFEIEVLTPIVLPGNKMSGFFEVDNGEVKVYEIDKEFLKSLDPKFLVSAYAENQIRKRILEKAKEEGKAKLVLRRKLERVESEEALMFSYFDDASIADYVLEAIFRPLFNSAFPEERARIIQLIRKTSASGFEFSKKEGVIHKRTLYEAVASGERIEGTIEIDYDLSKVSDLFYLPVDLKMIGIKIPQTLLAEKFLDSMISQSFDMYVNSVKFRGLPIPDNGNLQIGRIVGNFGIYKVKFRPISDFEEVDKVSEEIKSM